MIIVLPKSFQKHPKPVRFTGGEPKSPIFRHNREVQQVWKSCQHYPVLMDLFDMLNLPMEEVALTALDENEPEGKRFLSYQKDPTLEICFTENLEEIVEIRLIPEKKSLQDKTLRHYIPLDVLVHMGNLSEKVASIPTISDRVKEQIKNSREYDINVHEIRFQYARSIAEAILEGMNLIFDQRTSCFFIGENGLLVSAATIHSSDLPVMEMLKKELNREKPGVFMFKPKEEFYYISILYLGSFNFGALCLNSPTEMEEPELAVLKMLGHTVSSYLAPVYF